MSSAPVILVVFTLVLLSSLSNGTATWVSKRSKSQQNPRTGLNMTGRIINGIDAQPGAWPFMVSLQFANTGAHFCGASVLNADTLLTAAHCFYNNSHPPDQAYIAQVDLSGERLEEYSFPVASFTVHPDFTWQTLTRGNDVAVVKLDRKIHFSTLDGVKKVCLPRSPEDLPNAERCVVLGWGKTEAGKGSTRLKQGDISILSTEQCQPFGENINHDVVFCAGEQGKGSCPGDSGGPLVCPPSQPLDGDGDQVWLQYGIVSFGFECGAAPVYYTRVALYLEWIKEHI